MKGKYNIQDYQLQCLSLSFVHCTMFLHITRDSGLRIGNRNCNIWKMVVKIVQKATTTTTKLKEKCSTNKILPNYWLLFEALVLKINGVTTAGCASIIDMHFKIMKPILTWKTFNISFSHRVRLPFFVGVGVCVYSLFSFSICVSLSIGVVVDC